MNIVILGAGTVGTSIAQNLCANQQNVILVDASRAALDEVEERLDVRSVCGSACDSVTLFQAGVSSADLCLAVTNHDEVNLVGASLAKAMGATRSVARVFNPSYLDYSTFDYQRHFGIDRLLSLENLTALELAKAIRTPGLFAVENFARGGIEVQEVAVEPDAKALGIPLRDLDLPTEVRIGMISNEKGALIAGADDVLTAGDHVTLIGKREEIEEVKRLFQRRAPTRLNVIIGGGGEIGYNLAMILGGGHYNVVLMDSNQERCEYVAEKLEDVTVLLADASRRSAMEEARVGKADIFVAATGRDEDNIICGVEARALGAKRIMCVVRRPDYANVLEKLGVDVAVSPREVMTRQVLGMVGGGPVLNRSSIAGGAAEVLEIDILEGAPITAAPLKEIELSQSLIAAIVREEYVRVPGADDQLRTGDTAVVLAQKDSVDANLKLFEP